MTYLDLVNNVLRRLRETEVASVQSTAYSKLIGDIVNDAKDLVENSWDWSALRNPLTITTSAGTYTYALTGGGNKVKKFNIINDTSNLVMYTFRNTDASDDPNIDVYPKPDGVYSLRFSGAFRNADLSANTDTLEVPPMPVVHLAVALAARERGETGGTSTQEYFTIANRYLADAIAQDAGRHPEETIFYTP
jgi:hypothetical protein